MDTCVVFPVGFIRDILYYLGCACCVCTLHSFTWCYLTVGNKCTVKFSYSTHGQVFGVAGVLHVGCVPGSCGARGRAGTRSPLLGALVLPLQLPRRRAQEEPRLPDQPHQGKHLRVAFLAHWALHDRQEFCHNLFSNCTEEQETCQWRRWY